MPSLKITNLEKHYQSFHALKSISLDIEDGEFVVMVGPSGCGKSTLLRSIAGLETVDSGTITIKDRDVTHLEPSDRGVAMVFQNYALYPHMTVAQNMGFNLQIAGRPKAEIVAAVDRAAKILRITDHLNKFPKALSGGQKQRVAIGRAITRSPDVFLFDEPLSNLDAALRTQMRVELGRLHKELGTTMIYVTHDQVEAMTMADRIVVMRDGIIEQVGSPLDLYNRPANQFVAGFLGSPRMNFLAASIEAIADGAVTLAIAGLKQTLVLPLDEAGAGLKIGDRVRIGFRPEAALADGTDGLVLPANVRVVESLGRETLVYADAGVVRSIDSESQDGFFAVHQSQQLQFAYDAPFTIGVPADALYLFDTSGKTRRFARRAA
ncbi:Maltose/maltodextrin import ATP-binding protein MalK [Devosia equisanguinis]|uniref:Maltose/maltodextrin import ATP-binding protein MalK n=1 Tax=Devosia equisanguinis TaxID=2490941 RepID=A0A3S5D3B7_9HYPH|nr:sn-glycerol-3-phosphate ABC transporter ATP-binding protein UgpC [Devosia equisanguinis]VDS04241.1 Maltose/maltodextrin import ATP-binding protein MalK [Devosia equisanguinis]